MANCVLEALKTSAEENSTLYGGSHCSLCAFLGAIAQFGRRFWNLKRGAEKCDNTFH